MFRSAEFVLKPFAVDRIGTVHSTLCYQFGGAFARWKACAKKIVEDTLVRLFTHGEGAGARAARYREAVEALYCYVAEDAISGPGVASLLTRLVAKRELLNGDYKNCERVEHYCNGCCSSRAHSVRRINEECIEPLQQPEPWNVQKWKGPKRSFVFHGEWVSTHNLLGRGHLRAFDTAYYNEHMAPKVPHATAGGPPDASRPDASEVGEPVAADPVLYALPIEDGVVDEPLDALGPDAPERLQMEEPSIESTAFERQSTYRGNASRWHRTAPCGRYAALKQVQSVQQDGIDHLMGQVGSSWETKETLRRAQGKTPEYRGVMIHTGKYNNDSLERYAGLVRESKRWDIITDKDKSHSLSCAVYRSSTSAAAITEQLQRSREKTFPYLPYGLIPAQGYAERRAKASEIIRFVRHFPCRVPPYWRELFTLFPDELAVICTALSC